MQKLTKITAVNLRIALIVSIVFLTALGGAGFYLFHQQLVSYAVEVNTDSAKAEASSQDISKLQQLEGEIKNDQVAITRAAKIVSDSKQYQYQDQIIDDIDTYANVAGIKIAGFTFDTAVAGTAAAAVPAPTTGTAGVAAPAITAPAGVKITTATITLAQGQNSYQSVMNFLKSIEQNLTKMNLSGISLQRNTTTSGGDVLPGAITIQVYTR
jgi:hypothetical protein